MLKMKKSFLKSKDSIERIAEKEEITHNKGLDKAVSKEQGRIRKKKTNTVFENVAHDLGLSDDNYYTAEEKMFGSAQSDFGGDGTKK
jgi:hypothetical protein